MRNKIRLIMERENMSQQEFAQRLKISPASLSSIFTGRTNPTNTHVMAIHNAFPSINISWLLFGEGTMYSDATETQNLTQNDVGNSESGICQNDMPSHSQGVLLVDDGGVARPQQSAKGTRSLGTVQSQSSGLLERENLYQETEMVRIVDKRRSIKEIRVFYDDGTYESFAPSSK